MAGLQFATITVVGTLGRDAELAYTPQGSANLKFSMASDKGKGDEKRTRWFNVTVWGKQAEALQQYLTKGKIVAVSGDFDVREYKDKNGKDRYSLDINANTLQLVGGGDRDANAGNTSPAAKAKAEPADDFDFGGDTSDDVPF